MNLDSILKLVEKLTADEELKKKFLALKEEFSKKDSDTSSIVSKVVALAKSVGIELTNEESLEVLKKDLSADFSKTADKLANIAGSVAGLFSKG